MFIARKIYEILRWITLKKIHSDTLTSFDDSPKHVINGKNENIVVDASTLNVIFRENNSTIFGKQ